MAKIDEVLLAQTRLESAGPCNIVINSKIMQKQGKQIFVNLNKGKLNYYYKDAEKIGGIAKKVELDNFGDTLQQELESETFCGVRAVRIPADERSLTVRVDSNLRLVFIETNLYSKIRELVTSGSANRKIITLTTSNGSYTLKAEELMRYIEAFKTYSCANYMQIVYSTRFLNKISKMRGGSFYSLLKVFIPVLIETDYLYNPLTDNPSLNFRQTKLYKKAEEMGRVREVLPGGALKVSLLTHLEICEALEMTHFVRFTPTFLYKFMIGSFYGGEGLFPNTQMKVRALPEEYYLPSKLKRVYTEQDYVDTLLLFKRFLDAARDNKNEEDIKTFTSCLESLRMYNEMDTLRWHISLDFDKMMRFGIRAFDDKITQTDLYDYLRVAKF